MLADGTISSEFRRLPILLVSRLRASKFQGFGIAISAPVAQSRPIIIRQSARTFLMFATALINSQGGVEGEASAGKVIRRERASERASWRTKRAKEQPRYLDILGSNLLLNLFRAGPSLGARPMPRSKGSFRFSFLFLGGGIDDFVIRH
jgi:hypothetical protein